MAVGGGGGGGGGGRGGGGGGGGRRSDIALKHDVVLLGHLDNGLGYYRFSYLGSSKAYVGVMAQEVQTRDAGGRDARQRRLSPRLLRKARIEIPNLSGLAASGAQIPDAIEDMTMSTIRSLRLVRPAASCCRRCDPWPC